MRRNQTAWEDNQTIGFDITRTVDKSATMLACPLIAGSSNRRAMAWLATTIAANAPRPRAGSWPDARGEGLDGRLHESLGSGTIWWASQQVLFADGPAGYQDTPSPAPPSPDSARLLLVWARCGYLNGPKVGRWEKFSWQWFDNA